MVEKGGLDSARITAVGYGDSKPAATNANEEGRTKNRRVEILLYGPDTELQAPTTDAQNQAQKQGHDSSGLSARGTNSQLSTPQAVSPDSGAGTLSVGQQQSAATAGDGAASSNNPGTSGAPSSNPSQQDSQQPAGSASF
jgi:chemotaxis protein MotB